MCELIIAKMKWDHMAPSYIINCSKYYHYDSLYNLIMVIYVCICDAYFENISQLILINYAV